MTPGQRWLTRSGAVVEIVERRDTGLVTHDLEWKPTGKAYMLICKFIRYVDGVDPLTDEPPTIFGLHDDGCYGAREHPLDLMRLCQQVAA